jgi:hypothetical protein
VGRGSIRRLAFGHGATRPPSSGTSDFFLINSPDRPWHRSANSFQGILEVFHKRFNNPAYAWLLSLNPKRDEHAYQLGYPLMTHGEEIDGNVLPPPAPSGVYPEMGFAFLRADESPGYWSGRGMAAYLQIHGNYFHRTRGEDFQLILSGQGRLLYPQFTVVNYEPPPYKWTEHPIGHNTVVIDGAQFDRVASQEVERTERHHFGKLAKFVAATGNVTAGVKQTRALVMTQDYLADMFALSSDRPHTYDWALHGIGKLRASHLSQFAKSSDLGHYRWIRNERRALTDGLWYAEWLQRGGGVMPGVGRYGREWFGDSVGIRTWMLPRSGTMVYMGDGPRLAPPYGRELGNPEGALPMVIARRKTRATVFAAIHDAFDVKDGPCVGSVRKVVSNQDACALRVDGLEFSDRLMVSFTDTGRATSIRSQDDSNEQFTFKNFGFLRWSEGQDDAEEQNLSKIRARRLTVEGDVLAFSVFAPFTKGEIFKLNGKDASCTRTGNYLLYKTEASALQDKERDRRAKIPMAHDFVLSFVHDELGVHKGNTTEARLNVTSTGHGIGESKIVFEASAGIALAPEGLTIRDLKIGETREWPLKITVARDAPDQGMVAARCLHWNQGHASIKVRVNSGLTIEEDEPDSYMPDAKELRFPGFEDGIHDYLVKAPGYIVRVNRETGSVVSLQDRTGRAWTRGPGGYFRRGKKHIGSCFDWWGEVEKEERQADTIRFSFATGLHVEYRFPVPIPVPCPLA